MDKVPRSDSFAWNDTLDEQALELFDAEPDYPNYRDIAFELGCSEPELRARLVELRRKRRYHSAETGRVSRAALDDRAARKAAALERDYTSEFFGDPPAGFSARDGKQGMTVHPRDNRVPRCKISLARVNLP